MNVNKIKVRVQLLEDGNLSDKSEEIEVAAGFWTWTTNKRQAWMTKRYGVNGWDSVGQANQSKRN